MQEDLAILEHVIGDNPMPCNVQEMKNLHAQKQSFIILESSMKRNSQGIHQRWTKIILPTILKHLDGASNLQWRTSFLQHIVDSKLTSITEMNWTFALERWEFETKGSLISLCNGIVQAYGKKGVPLYKTIEENMYRYKGESKMSKHKKDLIAAFDWLKEKKKNNMES